MTIGTSGVINYALLTVLWLTVCVLYARQRHAAKDDALIRMLLTVLILDAAKTTFESIYFGLTWGANWGVLPAELKVLGNPLLLSAVKLPTVALGIGVLVWVIRWWVPTELTERRSRREGEVRLREELEQSLKTAAENEERFRLAATASRDAVWDWNLATNTVFTSPRFAELLGHPLTWSPTRDNWLAHVHPDDRARVQEYTERSIAGGLPTYQLQYRGLHTSGRILHLEASAVVLRDQQGAVRRLVGFTRDISDQRAAEEQRVQTQKLESLALLAGGIAHDFNNLLAVISASLSLAERQSQTKRPVNESLATASLAVERAALLTRQLLAYAGSSQPPQHPLDANELVRALTEMLAMSVSRKIRIESKLAESLPAVMGDDGQLQQVVMNLITNAAEAIGDRDGTITLESAVSEASMLPSNLIGAPPPGPVVVLRVSDTGVGMSPEVRARIFDPFFSTKGAGRGLGLAALAGILRAHQGAIGLESVVGQGSTFSVYLPALPAAMSATSVRRPQATGPTEALNARVLIVDDEDLLRRSASRLLKHLGCTVVESSNGRQAVELVTATPNDFDLVLMDVTMPVMNGFEACAAIQAVAPKLPVVLSSGYAQDFDARLPPGAKTLSKPYTAAQLEELLRATGATAR